jgi:hypothetical protein
MWCGVGSRSSCSQPAHHPASLCGSPEQRAPVSHVAWRSCVSVASELHEHESRHTSACVPAHRDGRRAPAGAAQPSGGVCQLGAVLSAVQRCASAARARATWRLPTVAAAGPNRRTDAACTPLLHRACTHAHAPAHATHTHTTLYLQVEQLYRQAAATLSLPADRFKLIHKGSTLARAAADSAAATAAAGAAAAGAGRRKQQLVQLADGGAIGRPLPCPSHCRPSTHTHTHTQPQTCCS